MSTPTGTLREELARREVEKARDATYVFNSLTSMGIDPPMTADVMAYCCSVASWLFAEAEHNRLQAEVVLRSYAPRRAS